MSPKLPGRPAARVRQALAGARWVLPHGRLLPDDEWHKRHRALVAVLWLHAAGLAVFATAMGHAPVHSVLEASLVGLAALVAGRSSLSRKLRAGVASWGLVTASALLVHFWGGVTEGHFHFFVVIALLTVYQDWVPFLLALVYVVLHHGVMGAIDPGSVYNHPAASENPWAWAALHAGFVVAASIANLVVWRVNEQPLLREPLTGLPGRAVFRDRLTQALARLHRHPKTVAVMLVDLDRFKRVNDTLGHAAGDELLVRASERLRGNVRVGDSVSRFGGDEFAVLCQDISGEEAILRIATRLAEALAEPLIIGGHEVQTTASVGIAFTSDPGVEADALLHDADAAMYRAKEHGGGRVEAFDESMHERARRRMEVESALRQAVARDELRLHYQPEICLTTGRVVAVEALVRWERPGHGLVAPADFIPLAEETGLIVPIGTWVIQEACRQAQRWRLALPDRPTPRMRVNVSPRQLVEPGFVPVVREALASTATDPAELDLELTETTIVRDIERSAATLDELKRLGVRLSVDDFGTGYSSLSYLKDFPVDTLKIDRSFVHGLDGAPAPAAIVASIVDLAHALGMSVTAEGVEDAAQLRDLRDMGCDTAQGFFWTAPKAADAITELLQVDRPYGERGTGSRHRRGGRGPTASAASGAGSGGPPRRGRRALGPRA